MTNGRHMNPLYGTEGHDDSLVMGYISWSTITQPKVTSKDLEALVGSLGLNKSIVPKPPRPGDAFKRACRYSGRNGLTTPLSANTVNMLIRDVASTKTDIERHIVMEVVDPLDRVLSHEAVVHLRFDRQKGVLHVKEAKGIDDLYVELVQETLKLFVHNLDEAQKYIDGQVIRRMLRDQLDLLGAISVRKHGSVYFVPKAYKEQVMALEELCTHLGEGSQFVAIPLNDATKYREMVAAAFENELHQELTKTIAELKTVVKKGEQVTAAEFDRHMGRLKELKSRSSEYGDLVEVETFKAQTELQAMEKHLRTVLLNGQIKESKS